MIGVRHKGRRLGPFGQKIAPSQIARLELPPLNLNHNRERRERGEWTSFELLDSVADFGIKRDLAAGAHIARDGHHGPGRGNLHPARELFGRETIRDRNDAAARPDSAEIGDHAFGRHRHVERHAVAGHEPVLSESVCKLVHALFELLVAESLEGPVLLASVEDRGRVSRRLEAASRYLERGTREPTSMLHAIRKVEYRVRAFLEENPEPGDDPLPKLPTMVDGVTMERPVIVETQLGRKGR